MLTAPFAGTVGTIHLNVGQAVSPSALAISLGDLSRLQVETTDLAETDVSEVAVGQSANVTGDAFPGKTLPGRVTHIAPEANVYRGDQTYKVTIALPDAASAGLRWGMTAKVSIPTKL